MNSPQSQNLPKKPFLLRFFSLFYKPQWSKQYHNDWVDMWLSFSWSLAGALLTSLILIALIMITNTDPQDASLIEDFIATQSPFVVFLSVGVFAPVVEEVVFRGYLTSNVAIRYVCTLLGLIYLVVSFGFTVQSLLFCGLYLGILFTAFRRSKTQFEHTWLIRCLIYVSALSFAFIHLGNYTNLLDFLIFIPLLVSAQFILGLMATYMRMRHGLLSAILLHAMYNTFLFLGFTLQTINPNPDLSLLLLSINILYGSVYLLALGTAVYSFYRALEHIFEHKPEQLQKKEALT